MSDNFEQFSSYEQEKDKEYEDIANDLVKETLGEDLSGQESEPEKKKNKKEKKEDKVDKLIQKAEKLEKKGEMDKAEDAWKKASGEAFRQKNIQQAIDLAIQSGDQDFVAELEERKRKGKKKNKTSQTKEEKADDSSTVEKGNEAEQKESPEKEKLKKFYASGDVLRKGYLPGGATLDMLYDLEKFQKKINEAMSSELLNKGKLSDEIKESYTRFREALGLDQIEELEKLQKKRENDGLTPEEEGQYDRLRQELGVKEAEDFKKDLSGLHQDVFQGKDYSSEEKRLMDMAGNLGILDMEKLGRLENSIKEKEEKGENPSEEKQEFEKLKRQLGIDNIEELGEKLGLLHKSSEEVSSLSGQEKTDEPEQEKEEPSQVDPEEAVAIEEEVQRLSREKVREMNEGQEWVDNIRDLEQKGEEGQDFFEDQERVKGLKKELSERVKEVRNKRAELAEKEVQMEEFGKLTKYFKKNKKEEFSNIKQEYEDIKKEYQQAQKEALKANLEWLRHRWGGDSEKFDNYYKRSLSVNFFDKEPDKLRRQKIENLPEKDRGRVKQMLGKMYSQYSKMPRGARWAASAAVGTGVAFGLGATGGGLVAAAGYGTYRFGRAALGAMSAAGVQKMGGELERFWQQKRGGATEEERKRNVKEGFSEQAQVEAEFQDMMSLAENKLQERNDKLEELATSQKRWRIGKMAAAVGAGAGISFTAGMNFAEFSNIEGGGNSIEDSKDSGVKEGADQQSNASSEPPTRETDSSKSGLVLDTKINGEEVEVTKDFEDKFQALSSQEKQQLVQGLGIDKAYDQENGTINWNELDKESIKEMATAAGDNNQINWEGVEHLREQEGLGSTSSSEQQETDREQEAEKEDRKKTGDDSFEDAQEKTVTQQPTQGTEAEVADNKIASVEYQGGSSLWEESEKQLEARLADKLERLGEDDPEAARALKTYNIDRLKDVIVEYPEKHGLPKNFVPYTITEEQLRGVDWDQAFRDAFMENGERDLTEKLSEQEVKNINEYEQSEQGKEAEGAEERAESQQEPIRGEEVSFQDLQERAEELSDNKEQTKIDKELKDIFGEIATADNRDLREKAAKIVNLEDGLSDQEKNKLIWLADNPGWLEEPNRAKEFFAFAEDNGLNYEQSQEIFKIESESIFKDLSREEIMEYYFSLNGIEALEADKKRALIELFHDPNRSSTEVLCADILESDHLRKVTSSLEDGKLNLYYDLSDAMDFEVVIFPNGEVNIDGPWGWDKKFDSIKDINKILSYPVEAINKMKEAGENSISSSR
jgi:hypothetical protein